MALAGLRVGAEAQKPSGGGRQFTPYISWSAGDAKTILFTTPAEQIPKIRIHNFVKVPADNERGFNWRTFMCRKDPAWVEESGNTCQLCDVIGHKAKEVNAAIAVELDTTFKPGTKMIDSLEVRTREYEREDGTKINFPQWGLVLQANRNFFSYFFAHAAKYGTINDKAFDVVRVGDDQGTTYPVDPLHGTPIPDLSPFEEYIPDLVDVLEELGSKERYDRELNGVEPGSQEQLESTPAPEETVRARTKFEELRAALPGTPQGAPQGNA